MIEIRKFIEPDIEKILPTNSNYGAKYQKHSIIFKEGVMAVADCDEEGRLENNFGSPYKYYGCRLDGDIIEVCIPKFGWIKVYEEIQEIYNEELAEKELLRETTDKSNR